jgi:hypothetical protein
MKCSECGDEVPSGFKFCGRCGSPSRASVELSAGDQLSFPQQDAQQPQFQIMRGLQHTTKPRAVQPQPPTSSMLDITSPSMAILNATLQSDQNVRSNPPSVPNIHHEATEAIMMPPIARRQATPPAPIQTYGFPGPTMVGQQNFLPEDHHAPTSIAHPPTRPLSSALPPTSQSDYGNMSNNYHPRTAPLFAQKHTTPLVISICLVVIVIMIICVAIIYPRSQQKQSQASSTPQVSAATPKSSTPTSALTPTPTLSPTPTLAPTPIPDAGFIWCGVECAPSSFMDEYPNGWQMSALTGIIGMQFVNPLQPDQLAVFKRQDNPTAAADAILANELQTTYGAQPGYQAPNPPTGTDVTIGGETWSAASIVYLGSTQQPEQVTAYVTVHQGKVFIVEMQSAQAQFAQVGTAYYNIMIGKFQFI